MSRSEITSEIQKLIDSMPEEVLTEVLAFLKECSERSGKEINLSRNLGKIISEDGELLKRLAQ